MAKLNARSIAEMMAAFGVKSSTLSPFTPLPKVVTTRAEAIAVLELAAKESAEQCRKLIADHAVDEHEERALQRILAEPDLGKRIRKLSLWCARVLELDAERQKNLKTE